MKPIAHAAYTSALAAVLMFSGFKMVTAYAYDCDKYAQDAVRAYRWSQDKWCSFRGPQWSSNYEGHKGWCRTAPEQWIINESALRSKLITACRNAHTDCYSYGETAIAQNWANKNFAIWGNMKSSNCPTVGRWHDDRKEHETWCLRASPEQRRYEIIYRGKALQGGPC